MDNYWKELYKKFNDTSPSPFAIFCNNYISENDVLLDLGCGNGRDSYYFAKKTKKVMGIDKNNCPISKLPNLYFQLKDVVDVISNNTEKEITNVIYIRFLFHSIDDELKKQLLKWSYDSLVKGGLLMIENRDKEDYPLDLFGKHKRFLIDSSDFLKTVLGVGFKLSYFIKSRDLSPFKEENPLLFRIIAEK